MFQRNFVIFPIKTTTITKIEGKSGLNGVIVNYTCGWKENVFGLYEWRNYGHYPRFIFVFSIFLLLFLLLQICGITIFGTMHVYFFLSLSLPLCLSFDTSKIELLFNETKKFVDWIISAHSQCSAIMFFVSYFFFYIG